jgi:rhodanese-related sulfurtransferase
MIILMISTKNLLLLAIVTIIAVSCARFFTKGGDNKSNALMAYANMGVEEFQNFIAEPKVQLLDVRTPEEFSEGHIAGARLVDVNDSTFVEQAMGILDKQRPVAVYCRSGRRSARAASLLANKGFQVTNLDGGVLAWGDAGKVLVK